MKVRELEEKILRDFVDRRPRPIVGSEGREDNDNDTMVIVGRGDDHRLIIHFKEAGTYDLEQRMTYGTRPSDLTIRDRKEVQMIDAVRDFFFNGSG
jgi:hypothetical protein